MFAPEELGASSSYRELAAVLHGMEQAAPLFHGQTLLWYTDAKNLIRIIKRGSMIPDLLNMVLHIHRICREHSITLHVTWVPRKQNQYADDLSRLDDSDDWSVATEWFHYIAENFHFFPNIDCFASASNSQVPRYNSKFFEYLAEATDAFAQEWQYDRKRAVPPIYEITRVLNFLPTSNSRTILIIPEWTSATYWPRFLQFQRQYAKNIRCTLLLHNIFKRGTSARSMFGSESWSSNTLALLLDFKM